MISDGCHNFWLSFWEEKQKLCFCLLLRNYVQVVLKAAFIYILFFVLRIVPKAGHDYTEEN
jgi:hypothetical protein